MVKDWFERMRAAATIRRTLVVGVAVAAAGLALMILHPRANAARHSRVALPDSIRGVYVRPAILATPTRGESFFRSLRGTKVNTIVMDVKDDGGVLYESGVRLASSVSRHKSPLMLRETIETAHEHGLYVIARIVTFKDVPLARRKPGWALHRSDGRLWVDRSGAPWLDPWNRSAWDYNLQIAEEVARAGADAIQFDYVRFPEPFRSLPAQVASRTNAPRQEAIVKFLSEARHRLGRLGIPVAADVFGYAMHVEGDLNIGQQWEALLEVVDQLSPMVYPSHYSAPGRGLPHPNACPYAATLRTLSLGASRARNLRRSAKSVARIVPWLQAFDAGWVDARYRYGPKAVAAQIRATYGAGLRDWILWNPKSEYEFIHSALVGDAGAIGAADVARCNVAFPRTAAAPHLARGRRAFGSRSASPFDP